MPALVSHAAVIKLAYGALHQLGDDMKVRIAILIGMLAATAAPAAGTVMIQAPVRLPSGCFASDERCEAEVAVAAPSASGSDRPNPMIAIVVGALALGLAFGRRASGLQEVAS